VELSRLSYDARFEIMRGAQEAVGVEIEYNTAVRITTISDGFPHYIHLICEKLFWEMFEAPQAVATSDVEHYRCAVMAAVEDAQPYLRALYDKAVRKYQRDYEHVLWAAADHPNLERRSIEIFDAYCSLFKNEQTRLSRDRFNQRLNALKTPSRQRPDRHAAGLVSVQRKHAARLCAAKGRAGGRPADYRSPARLSPRASSLAIADHI
jgi:hypothetical protein